MKVLSRKKTVWCICHLNKIYTYLGKYSGDIHVNWIVSHFDWVSLLTVVYFNSQQVEYAYWCCQLETPIWEYFLNADSLSHCSTSICKSRSPYMWRSGTIETFDLGKVLWIGLKQRTKRCANCSHHSYMKWKYVLF